MELLLIIFGFIVGVLVESHFKKVREEKVREEAYDSGFKSGKMYAEAKNSVNTKELEQSVIPSLEPKVSDVVPPTQDELNLMNDDVFELKHVCDSGCVEEAFDYTKDCPVVFEWESKKKAKKSVKSKKKVVKTKKGKKK